MEGQKQIPGASGLSSGGGEGRRCMVQASRADTAWFPSTFLAQTSEHSTAAPQTLMAPFLRCCVS